MFRLLFLFLIVALAIGLGPLIIGHQGQVVITTEANEYTTSITALCIAIIALIAALFFIQWLVRRLYRFSSATTGWFFGRPQVRASKQTKAGLLRLLEGDYAKAQQLFSRSAPNSSQPVVNYLLAAEAAQRRKDILAVNEYLEQATLLAGENQLAVDITRIRIQLATGASEAASHKIDQLLNNDPRHPELLRLARQAYLESGAYSALLAIVPSMRKIALYDDIQLDSLESQAYTGIMRKEVASQGGDGLKRWLATLSSKQRHNPAIVAEAATLFIECKDSDMAEQLILEGLKHQYDERLINLISKFNAAHPEQLEKVLRKIVSKQGATPLLNSTLGRLLIQRSEWQSASEFLQEAIAQRPNVKDYALLAMAYDAQSLLDKSAEARQKGLALASR